MLQPGALLERHEMRKQKILLCRIYEMLNVKKITSEKEQSRKLNYEQRPNITTEFEMQR